MLVFGTQMHLITFVFVSIEVVIFFHLLIHRLARPDDKRVHLNIVLIFLLIIYNITGGLLPDPKLPGSFFTQNIIAYATGFITPCYFPFYVFKAFGLNKMKFHAYKGVYLFLVIPYLIFVLVFAITKELEDAQNILIIPMLYAIWVILSLYKSIRFKYEKDFKNKESKQEISVLFLSITPWVSLPVIAYYNLSQSLEASITNIGFLLLFSFHVNRQIKKSRADRQRLILSEQELLASKQELLDWNTKLQHEVNKRTNELQKINEQKTNNFINLVHETKTPLTLIHNYLEEYIAKNGMGEELSVIRGGINKLTKDIISLFDIERFNKGFEVYNHNQVVNFSELLEANITLFCYYCEKKSITCHSEIEKNIFIKADPSAIYRIINNLVENAIKFSNSQGRIDIRLKKVDNKITFSVKDDGIGICPPFQKRIFEPYYQINNEKTSLQGLGLGLPIVKKVVESLGGEITIHSKPAEIPGTLIAVTLTSYLPTSNNVEPLNFDTSQALFIAPDNPAIADTHYAEERKSLLLIEDNKAMLSFLSRKLSDKYNVFCAINGADALKKIQEIPVIPDLIISDVMMDKMTGFAFAKSIAEQKRFSHVPIIFVSAKSTPTDKIKGLRLGAVDFISKPFSIDELINKVDTLLNFVYKQKVSLINAPIRNVEAHNGAISNVPGTELVSDFEKRRKLFRLTEREVELVKLIAKGTSYKIIGKSLFIAETTVRKHVQHIYEKVGVSNKVELLKKLQI